MRTPEHVEAICPTTKRESQQNGKTRLYILARMRNRTTEAISYLRNNHSITIKVGPGHKTSTATGIFQQKLPHMTKKPRADLLGKKTRQELRYTHTEMNKRVHGKKE